MLHLCAQIANLVVQRTPFQPSVSLSVSTETFLSFLVKLTAMAAAAPLSILRTNDNLLEIFTKHLRKSKAHAAHDQYQ
jgi:hypothetical protein